MSPRAALVLVAAALVPTVACAGPRIGAVRPSSPAAVASVPPIQRVTLVPDIDAVAHDGASFRDRSMHDEVWLMAGADERGRHWYTWLQFDLSTLPSAWTASNATLVLTRSDAETIRNEADAGAFLIFAGLEPAGEEPTWSDQPRIERLPLARFDSSNRATVDEVDLGGHVERLRSAGYTTMTLVIVPRDPDAPFRRLWHATESNPPTEHFSGVPGEVPRLILDAGPAAPPLPAAARDGLLPPPDESRP